MKDMIVEKTITTRARSSTTLTDGQSSEPLPSETQETEPERGQENHDVVAKKPRKPRISRANKESPRKRVSIKKKEHVFDAKSIVREKSPEPNSTSDETPTVCDNDAEKTKQNQPATIYVEGKKLVQCNICKKHLIESRLANHIRLMHVVDGFPSVADSRQISRPHKCEYCGKCYSLKYTYTQHVKTHTEGRLKCPECGSTFASTFSLFRHRARAHGLDHDYKTYNCDKCSKRFFSVSELTLHQQRHSEVKQFECPECKRGFSVKGNLRIHMRTHAKQKLYKCDICDYSFSHPYTLISHRRIHTNDFPFKCEVCQKEYRSKHQLTSHKNVHSNLRPFKCDECSKDFKSRTAFKMHQDEHKGIKRFTCQFCERQFQCFGNKLKHERRHIGDKKHKCEQCDKAFIERQELKNHLKVHDKRDLAVQNKLAELYPRVIVGYAIDEETKDR